jgi:hypothetical protein
MDMAEMFTLLMVQIGAPVNPTNQSTPSQRRLLGNPLDGLRPPPHQGLKGQVR